MLYCGFSRATRKLVMTTTPFAAPCYAFVTLFDTIADRCN